MRRKRECASFLSRIRESSGFLKFFLRARHLKVPLSAAARVYVYDVEDYPELQRLTSGPAICKNTQWGFEVTLHDWFLACPCRTDNPEEALQLRGYCGHSHLGTWNQWGEVHTHVGPTDEAVASM